MNNTSALKFPLILLAFIIFTLPVKASLSRGLHLGEDSARRRPVDALVFPVPSADANTMFYLQRTTNTATLMYELNPDKETGKLDTDEPMHVYWIRYNEKGQKEELNYIQRKFAYGLSQKSLGNDKYDIRFVSYKKFPLTLMKAADGKYHIFATVSQKLMALRSIFIKIEGGSFWLPNIVYVEMKGTDPATGKEITERFKP
ncbi:DUF4833 domain-containing protein [Mucilaginibacter gilvus]|uniref:DUF4833 domain-containing protein n=1 Tax=Mucilaginibacter gilvus TaxID=2305909 RepID=A0A3S3Z039_9SPHI|nr:DUF4833 domain-containing protein [Mucilaginibacter gilvus]RWY49999.1 DUF4833 domain-containing protein [Mucilaginibacter gilvus]